MPSKTEVIQSDFVVRKTLLLAMLLIVSMETHAQLDVNKPVIKTPASGLDPSITGRRVMDVLTPGLKLDDNQNSKVTILVGQFLTHKSGFFDLSKSKPADYKAKFGDEQQVLFDGLKNVLTPEQFKQLMNLKPPEYNTENATSHLFY